MTLVTRNGWDSALASAVIRQAIEDAIEDVKIVPAPGPEADSRARARHSKSRKLWHQKIHAMCFIATPSDDLEFWCAVADIDMRDLNVRYRDAYDRLAASPPRFGVRLPARRIAA
jgi:hypothetical protein